MTRKEVEAEVKTPEPEIPTPVTEVEPLSPQGELDALRQRFQEVEQKANQFEREAKIHRETISSKDKEILKSRSQVTDMQAMKEMLTLQGAMIADLIDKEGGVDEETPPPRTSSYRKKLEELGKKPEDTKHQEWEQELIAKALEAENLAKEAGLEMATAPELDIARIYFRQGDGEIGLARVKDIIAKIPKSKVETEDEIKARLEKEILIKHKLLTPEGAQPSGVGGELTAAIVAKMTPDERFARRDEIAKMPLIIKK